MNRFLRTVQTRWEVQSHRRSFKAADGVGFEAVLTHHGLAAKIDRGELRCKYCRGPITRVNVYALFRESGALKIVCTDPSCIGAFLQRWGV